VASATPLAVDFANTRRRRGAEYQELVCSGGDLAAWAEDERGRVPSLSADAAQQRLGEVRALRDEVVELLGATARGQTSRAERVNAALRTVPLVPQLDSDGSCSLHAPPAADPLDELLARVAASAIELATEADSPLALCDAPSCGRFFMRHRRDQRWCGPACGTRARVARHAAQQRKTG
jgi:predicted RNA-binding Zn ribbon-like protein